MNTALGSLRIASVATFVGLITFLLNWYFYDWWDGPMPGYKFLLYPGNLSLICVWHPLFTEEMDVIPKLALMLLGQFVIVGALVHAVFYPIVRIVCNWVQGNAAEDANL